MRDTVCEPQRPSKLEAKLADIPRRLEWEGIVPKGALRGSLFGIDMLLVEGLGKVVYSIQLNLRRGINTFNRWEVRALYSQAIAAQQHIATHGRSPGHDGGAGRVRHAKLGAATQQVLAEAGRQVAAASAKGLRVEWLISDANAENQPRALFQREGVPITLTPLAE